jgi:hypothetical protein
MRLSSRAPRGDHPRPGSTPRDLKADRGGAARLEGMTKPKAPTTKPAAPSPTRASKAATPKAPKGSAPSAPKAASKASKPAAAPAPKGKPSPVPVRSHGMTSPEIQAHTHRHIKRAAGSASQLCGLSQRFLVAAFDAEMRRQAGVKEWADLEISAAVDAMLAASDLESKLRSANVRRLTGKPISRARLSDEGAGGGPSPAPRYRGSRGGSGPDLGRPDRRSVPRGDRPGGNPRPCPR